MPRQRAGCCILLSVHELNILVTISISIIGAAALALVARAIRQPLLLGYIAAGAILGPHVGLGMVTDEKSIELISEIGLILLLFIIGLEISVPRLAQAGRIIVVSGLLQFPICAMLTWLAVGGLARGLGGPFDRLYLAVTLSLSSTLIVVKLLSDKFELSTFAGRVTLGILIFQDLWAIVFLALQPNLEKLTAGTLVKSFAAGILLVIAAAMTSRFVLPRVFRWIATSPELVLVWAMAWCFLVSGAAGYAGLSAEMGALVAGMVIAAFPYGTEVVSRLSGVRDFFITLFFVALGLQIPEPSGHILVLALAAAAVVVVTRILAIYPIFALLRLDTLAAGVVTVNLSQISEFSLVIVALGAAHKHVSDSLQSLVLYAVLIMAVLSTYGIKFNHAISSRVAATMAALGLPRWLGGKARQPAEAAADSHGGNEHDVFLLGVSREGLAFLQHLERESANMRTRVVAIDFNPENLERMQAQGIECHYGDISNPETLRHAGIGRARIVASLISDWFLKGTDNLRLLREVRGLAPNAQTIVTADTLAGAQRLYAEGAAYVLIPPALSAEHLYTLLRDATPETLVQARERQRQTLVDGVGGRRPAPPRASTV
jgi:Kef-type K+ transport system membrane component KefB